MASVWTRLFGAAAAVVCLVTALVGRAAAAEPMAAIEPYYFEQQQGAPGIVAYAPRDRERARPVVVMLHGMCSEPERTCAHFAAAVTQDSWLLCPRAKLRCPGGGSTWPHESFARDVEHSIQRVREAFPSELDERAGRTLIGFSLGAFRALDLAQSESGGYPRVLLIGARIEPDARRLQRAGVERLLLAAGDWDMTRNHMAQQSRILRRRGVRAAFQSLGAVGHGFPADFPQLLRVALDWTGGEGPPDGPELSRL